MNADEWQYYLSGQGRMTVFASQDASRTFNFRAGDVGYVPKSMSHYVQNTCPEPLRNLELFRANRYVDVSLHQWLALTPPHLVVSINYGLAIYGMPGKRRDPTWPDRAYNLA